MSKVDLLPNETIIMRDSAITHDRGGLFDANTDELVLTNLALIVVHKNFMGVAKDTQRFPLNQIKRANGNPQVTSGRSKTGERQLHIYFMHGVEAFTLGDSDEDADVGILESLRTSQSEREKRNLQRWCVAICDAINVLSHSNESDSLTFDSHGKSATNSCSHHITKKCIGCMAPLSGVQGQKVICAYCDTEQAL